MNLKCRYYLFIFILAFKSTGQFYPYIELGYGHSELGIGFKTGRISPFIGFDWYAHVTKNFDMETDTFKNESSDFTFMPLLGFDIHLIEKAVNLYTGFQTRSSFWAVKNNQKWYFEFLLGMGIEKRFKCGLALAGEYNFRYSVTKYEHDFLNEYQYYHIFGSAVKMSLKYYVSRRKKSED